jgi:hypothetical protein
MRISSVLWIGFVAVVAAAILPQSLSAHHGWGWAEDEEFVITGRIVGVRLGNPHGVVTIEAEGERWVVEVGQPWRNESAGLTPDLLAPGTVMTVHGHRSARRGERLVKAERIVIDGRNYNLYPDRES